MRPRIRPTGGLNKEFSFVQNVGFHSTESRSLAVKENFDESSSAVGLSGEEQIDTQPIVERNTPTANSTITTTTNTTPTQFDHEEEPPPLEEVITYAQIQDANIQAWKLQYFSEAFLLPNGMYIMDTQRISKHKKYKFF